jgi:hypothetical protein
MTYRGELLPFWDMDLEKLSICSDCGRGGVCVQVWYWVYWLSRCCLSCMSLGSKRVVVMLIELLVGLYGSGGVGQKWGLL